MLVGRSGSNALFVFDNLGVIVDESLNLVIEKGHAQVLVASAVWSEPEEPADPLSLELAEASITDLDIHVFSANDRLYTIPKSVQAEAKRALEWRKKHKRGGTPVGLNTARILARGGQIGIKKLRHIARYFPRHEVDKKGTGYRPGEPGFPSNGRIAWALWGGNSAQRWASSIVERDNKRKPTTAGGLPVEYFPPQKFELDSFKAAKELPYDAVPEFMCRCRLDGSGIDRLYMVDLDDTLYVWDDGGWDNLGDYDLGLPDMDSVLDDDNDDLEVPTMWIPVDVDTAVKIAAMLDNEPFHSPSVEEIDDEESMLVYDALPELDWTLLDDVMVAAGDPKEGGGTDSADGDYTPEERSENASRQVRDATGKFSKNGSRVVVGGDPSSRGVITSINPADQTVNVKLDNGTSVNVPAKSTQGEDSFQEPEPVSDIPSVPPAATQGILAEPRVASDQPDARIPGLLPPMTGNSISLLLNDWPAWVAAERELYAQTAPKPSMPTEDLGFDTTPPPSSVIRDPSGGPGRPVVWEPKTAPNAYNHPMLRGWLDQRKSDGTYPNRGWYNPLVTSDIIDPKMSAKKVNKGPSTWYADPDNLGVKKSSKSSYRYSYSGPGGSGSGSGSSSSTSAIGFTAAAEDAKAAFTPETSDVPPIYMALVAEDDPQAVMDLIALVPINSQSTTPTVFKRAPGEWVKDEGILADLNSPTPPPVVVLDSDSLASVVEQIDSSLMASAFYLLDRRITGLWVSREELAAIIAAGGLDRNRGQAEKLRRYWTVGKGGAKIRWNTGGDWKRCVRYLSKYLGPRARGYCALRHKEMTGMWTGDTAHRKLYGRKNFSIDPLIIDNESIIASAISRARIADAKNRVTALKASGAYEINGGGSGATFFIPLVIPEGVESGDGRKFAKDAIQMRDLPLPLMWQIKSGPGHDGSVVVGKITHMERTKNGIGHAYGVFDSGPYGQEAERLVRGGFIRGVSADLDRFEANEEEIEAADENTKNIGTGKINITKARVMAVTLVPKPAFQECSIEIVPDIVEQEEAVVADGVYFERVDSADADALIACGMVAGSIPVNPPAEWFADPKLKGATPLTVDDDGRVYGHIAAWHVDHIGMSFGTRPPRSASKYAYFHTGVVRADNGKDYPVGQLTLAGGHASLNATASEAVRHYDDTASAIADVHAGEDAHGIWVAGALRPGTTPEQIRSLRASAPSGDWRPIKGKLELVAVCQVNVPGFPIARARVASGEVLALVAAGASVLAHMKADSMYEHSDVLSAAEMAKARFSSILSDISPESVVASGDSSALAPILSVLLADTITLSHKVQGYHWNVVGEDFAQYHELFQTIYSDISDAIDPLAEDIRKLGYPTPYSVSDINNMNTLSDSGLSVAEPRAMVADLLECNEMYINSLNEAFSAANELNEQGIANFIAERVDMHKKWSWQLASSLPDMSVYSYPSAQESFEAVFSTLQSEGLIASTSSMAEMGTISPITRERLAKEGKALPDGSYPIRNVADLKNAIQAYGRAEASDRARVRRHIIKMARALDRMDLLPETWKVASDAGARVASAASELADFSPKQRERLAKEGKALPDGSYPIRNTADLKNAIQAYGRSKESERASVRRHIIKRARALKKTELIPDEWKEAAELEAVIASLRQRVTEFAADTPENIAPNAPTVDDLIHDVEEAKLPEPIERTIKYTARTQPRDARGRFRQVLARIKQDLGTSGNADALRKIELAENLDFAGNYEGAVKAASDLIGIIDRLDTGALNPTSLENVRSSAGELGKVIANLPFAFGQEAQKIRYSDIPPALRDLIDSMISRVEAKIGKEDADVATETLRKYQSGGDMMNQSEISSEMAKLLRLLT